MARKNRPAVVGVPASIRRINENEFHAVSTRYLEAVARHTGAEPVIIPAIGGHLDFEDLMQRVDGFFFTGCPSNVEPHHYDEPVNLTPDRRDPDRDATTLPLIRFALANAVPMFAICRGFQELNVALGGSLHQEWRTEETPHYGALFGAFGAAVRERALTRR